MAFVHIPKTAGRSVIHAFEQALGPAQCATFRTAIDDAAFAQARFVSGHVHLSVVTPDAFAFTFLRAPLAQIGSHLRWLDRYNEPAYAPETAPFSDSVRTIIRRVGQIDFYDAGSFARFFDWLPEDAEVRLRNVQSEVLAKRHHEITYTNTEDMALVAIGNLPRLGFVGVTEQADQDLAALFRTLGFSETPVITRQNQLSSRRRIDLTDAAIRAVLSREVAADLTLYRHVIQARRPAGTATGTTRLKTLLRAWRGG